MIDECDYFIANGTKNLVDGTQVSVRCTDGRYSSEMDGIEHGVVCTDADGWRYISTNDGLECVWILLPKSAYQGYDLDEIPDFIGNDWEIVEEES